MTFKYSIDPSSTAVQGTNFEIVNTTNSFVIEAGKQFAMTDLEYTIDPLSVAVNENLSLIINLESQDGGVYTLPLDIAIKKCDPQLTGTYTTTNSVGFGGDGTVVTVNPLDCSDNYQGSEIPAFNGVYTFEFNHNTADDTVEITGSEITALVSATSVITGTGVVLADGTIRFTGIEVTDTGLTGYGFDLVPNP